MVAKDATGPGGFCNSFSSAASLTCTISASATAAASVIATNDQPLCGVNSNLDDKLKLF